MIANTYNNATDAFEDLYEKIMIFGLSTKIGTAALYDVCITILHPEDNEITTKWRKWSKKYAEREWSWYLSCNRSVEELKKHAPIWDKMHNGNNIVNSNYGWQWNRDNQLEKCIEQLKKNNSTRRAWVTIYDGKEKSDYEFDTPCTLSIGFDIKANTPDRVDMTVIMRSNDIVFGFCNDQYCFSNLQKLVANKLGLQVGTYTHFAHDLHIYNYHFNLKSKNSK